MPTQLPPLAMLSPTGQRGWISTALLAAVIAIPYLHGALMRGRRRADNSPAPSPLMPLWPHYWLALALAALSSWHAWPGLRAGHISPSLTNGLWLATIALVLLLLQLAVGAVLHHRGPGPSSVVRRIHFVLMAAIALLVVAHVWLNSRFLRSLF
ncbi:MAG TPA: hypothetical protein VFB10_04570 [Candidatus Dormibacteraeota bacterium]|nr:hypothetical protein [Candidatus Dormibacteraeota bacterium]